MIRKLNLMWSLLIVLSMLSLPMVMAQGGALQGGDPNFDATAAEEEGYWYSRYNLGSLTMQSGNGEVFMPDQEMMMAVMQMVDADPTDGDTADPPANPAMLRIVYAGGDPHLVTSPIDEHDFATLRWVGGDTRVTTEASAWTIIKELEWAKLFHVDEHFGVPEDNWGAHQRFMGMVMALMPKMQVQAWMQEPDRFENSLAGDYVMLIALSDAASVYGVDTLPGSASNRYADPDTTAMFAQAADMLFQKVVASSPSSVRDYSLGIQSLVWYAAYTADAAARTAALDKIPQWADALASASHGTPVEHANVVRGLIEAGRVIDSKYLDLAANHFNALASSYDGTHGFFADQTTYTTDDVGTILGAINSARLFLGDRIDQAQAESIFAGFFEGTVNLSGLQISAPPVSLFKGDFEQDDPEIYYRYPTTPMPPMAGGEFGIAAVLASSVTWDGSKWTADQSHFDTAGAMHTANEMIWFHSDEVSGFPEVPVQGVTTLPVTGADAPSPYLPALAAAAGLLLVGGGLILRRRLAVVKQ